MDATVEIVDLDGVVMQAWHEAGISATRRAVEERLLQERKKRLVAARAAGRQAVAWGYVRRRHLHTPAGDLGPIRIPRMRMEGREVRLLPRYVRRVDSFSRMVAEATILKVVPRHDSGVSQRRMGSWLSRASGQAVSAATVGRMVLDLGGELEALREGPLDGERYAALAADGMWGRYRGGGDALLAVAVGVRWDGLFDVLDWQAGRGETAEVYETLFTRLWERGLKELALLVADGSGAIRTAQELVYPEAGFQLCLWHWCRTLRGDVCWADARRFSRDFWEVYDGLDRAEVLSRGRRFCRRWGERETAMVDHFQERWSDTLAYLEMPAIWRHRVRTVNLAEGFFRHFRRFFNRFPGFGDEAHVSRVLGLYLLGAKPELWHTRRRLWVA